MIAIAGRARSGVRPRTRTHNQGLCAAHLELKPNF